MPIVAPARTSEAPPRTGCRTGGRGARSVVADATRKPVKTLCGARCMDGLSDGLRAWRFRWTTEPPSCGAGRVPVDEQYPPTEFRELAFFDALNDRTWNTPALAGGFLLVRNDQEAACYELPLEEAP